MTTYSARSRTDKIASYVSLITPAQFIERQSEAIMKSVLAMGANVSTAHKAAGIFAEACEGLWIEKKS